MEEQIEIKVSWGRAAAAWGRVSPGDISTPPGLILPRFFPQRLRTENRLLKQRIETLEKVSPTAGTPKRPGGTQNLQEAPKISWGPPEPPGDTQYQPGTPQKPPWSTPKHPGAPETHT